MANDIPFAGNLDTKVQIWGVNSELNGLMERIETPVMLHETMAKVVSATVNEVIDTKVENVGKSVYIIRKRRGVTANTKLTLKDLVANVTFNITGVTILNRTHLIIVCESYG